MIGTLVLFARTLIRVVGWRVLTVVTTALVLALAEGAAVLSLVPLLQLAGVDMGQGGAAPIAEMIAATLALIGIEPTLQFILGAFVLLTAARSLGLRWQSCQMVAVEQDFNVRLQQRLCQAIVQADWNLLSRSRSSDLAHTLMTDVTKAGMAATASLLLATDLVICVAYVLVALQLSGALTVMVLGCSLVLLLPLKNRILAAFEAGESVATAFAELHAITVEYMGNLKLLKSYGAEQSAVTSFSERALVLAGAYRETARNYAQVRALFDIGAAVLLSLIVIAWISVAPTPIGSLLLLLLLFQRVTPRIVGLQQKYQGLLGLLPSFGRVVHLQACSEAAAERRSSSGPTISFWQEARLESVAVAYEPSGSVMALDGVDLVIRAGETTAIVGPSGAGKTTVADVLMGLLPPDRGRVVIDGTPLSGATIGSWREQLGYVPQDALLFHDTIRANLLWARPDATIDEVWAALRLADADEFVHRLPAGIETIVGDRGARMSGGERQRLALARALLRRPSLLIFDEATSNLDSESERRVERAIASLRGQATIVLITHRLTTVRDADQIYVLDSGRIVEAGRWEALLARPAGRLRALCAAQGVDLDVTWDRSLGAATGRRPA